MAKGVNAPALRIREMAKEHDVPIVENPSLACALQGFVEGYLATPAEHDKAAPPVIGCAMRRAAKRRIN